MPLSRCCFRAQLSGPRRTPENPQLQASEPWDDYNYDVFTDDIKKVLEELDLQNITLAGFSIGGVIVLHYMAGHKGERVAKLALFGAAAPSWTKKPGFPHGLDSAAVDDLIEQCYTDRAKLNKDVGKTFFRSQNAIGPAHGQWFLTCVW